MLNPKFFARIKNLFDNRDSLNLSSEDAWLLEKYYKDLIQAGAHLSDAQRARLTELNGQLSKLSTQFSKNLLADTNDLAIVVDSAEELDGLTANQISAAATAASDRGLAG
jgi:peptidyl-dipeptidase Dcp